MESTDEDSAGCSKSFALSRHARPRSDAQRLKAWHTITVGQDRVLEMIDYISRGILAAAFGRLCLMKVLA